MGVLLGSLAREGTGSLRPAATHLKGRGKPGQKPAAGGGCCCVRVLDRGGGQGVFCVGAADLAQSNDVAWEPVSKGAGLASGAISHNERFERGMEREGGMKTGRGGGGEKEREILSQSLSCTLLKVSSVT